MSYEPTLTVFLDASPCPRVEVYFASLPAGTARVTAYRTAGNRVHKVRGMVNATAAGAISRVDFEAPFGLPCSYQAECFDASGASLGFTGAASVTLAVAETWMHNPLDPQGASRVTFRQTAFQRLNRPVDGEQRWPAGRVVGAVMTRQRRGLTDVDVNVVCESEAEADRVQAMLGTYNRRLPSVLCIRVAAGARIRIPRPFYAGVTGDVEELDELGYSWGNSLIPIHMKASEDEPPAPGIFIPLVTYGDVKAAYKTYQALKSGLRTYGDWGRAYTIGGRANA